MNSIGLAATLLAQAILLSFTAMQPASAQEPRQIIEEVQRRSRSNSQRYEGTLEVIGGQNRIASKRWIFERLGSFGDSKAILRFTAPAEVKGVGLLIVNHPDRASDQWMWRPNIGRDQRIALQDRSTRFFGTDFSFEDLEERDVNQFDFKLLADEGSAWKIESKPRKASQYTQSYLWVKKDNYTIVKVEAYNKNGLMRVIDYRDFELASGIWTPRTTEVNDVTRKSRTILKYDKLEYNVPLKDDDFTLQALRQGVMIASGILLAALLAQNFEQRGFIENQTLIYPQSAPTDSGHVVDETLLRWEPSYKINSWLKLSGSIDAAADSHRQIERAARLDVDDRSIQRPAFSLRRMSATIHKGKVTAEIGRQFIRWGKADILNPTDRFAPKDYLSSVVDADFLGVSAARLTVESGGDTFDLVWQPWFTPSRTPLLNQRWTAVPQQAAGIPVVDLGARYPGGSQYGARWNHVGSGYEYSLCFFDGFDDLPLFDAMPSPMAGLPASVGVQRYYPQLRLFGGDVAVPLPWLTVKGEAAYFTSSTPNTDEYVLYVIQLERQVKEWSFVGGYAGEAVTRSTGNPLQFAPDRGFAKSFVGHAGLTIDANRSVALEASVRAAGSFVRLEYSQLIGQHWRATAGLAWIRGDMPRGDMADFIGQYHRNSYASWAVRYSF